MTERAEVTAVPATASSKVPGLAVGETTDLVLLVVYNDGSQPYRCSTCGKEYDTFNSCYAHQTHHTRTADSYKWDRSKAKPRGNGKPVLQDVIAAKIAQHAATIAAEIVDAIHGDLNSSLTSMSAEMASLRERLAEERSARQKAEKDLNRIRNLFKG